MDFFKRIGTDRHKFKVEFFFKKLTSNAKLPGTVSITIKRGTLSLDQGDHKKTTESKRQFGDDGVCDFKNEILSFEAFTLFFDEG